MDNTSVIRFVLTQQGALDIEYILEQESKSKSKKETKGRTVGGDPKDLKGLVKNNLT